MGSKKRSSDSVELDNHKTDTDELRKKVKKGKKNDGAVNLSSDKVSKKKKKDDGEVAKLGSNEKSSNADKPMERKKKRKAMDKEKHRASSGDDEVKPKSANVEVNGDEKRLSNGLPEFHIGVFKDLGAADVAVREAAAERLVTELKEVQKAYDVLEDKEGVEGEVKLEAEKNDGLNECAPSVRYAVRRLIRGVSSSREV